MKAAKWSLVALNGEHLENPDTRCQQLWIYVSSYKHRLHLCPPCLPGWLVSSAHAGICHAALWSKFSQAEQHVHKHTVLCAALSLTQWQTTVLRHKAVVIMGCRLQLICFCRISGRKCDKAKLCVRMFIHHSSYLLSYTYQRLGSRGSRFRKKIQAPHVPFYSKLHSGHKVPQLILIETCVHKSWERSECEQTSK